MLLGIGLLCLRILLLLRVLLLRLRILLLLRVLLLRVRALLRGIRRYRRRRLVLVATSANEEAPGCDEPK